MHSTNNNLDSAVEIKQHQTNKIGIYMDLPSAKLTSTKWNVPHLHLRNLRDRFPLQNIAFSIARQRVDISIDPGQVNKSHGQVNKSH